MISPFSDALTLPKGYPTRILVVEDNVLLRYTLTEWLRESNFTVVEAVSADEAIIILSSAIHIDLVITDIEMPGSMNGYDLTHYIRENYSALPVIMVSGKPPSTKAAIKGPYEFMQKPYQLPALSKAIVRLLPNNEKSKGH